MEQRGSKPAPAAASYGLTEEALTRMRASPGPGSRTGTGPR
jgi:hypothetical protein